MVSRQRLFVVVSLMVLVGAASLVWRPTSSAVLYSGYARADTGPLTLEITVDPPIGSPGDTLRVNARVTNHSPQPLTPSIVIQLPSGLSGNVYALPPGATFNLQESRIDWLPVVPNGAAVEFNLDVVIQSADVLTPERDVIGILRHQGNESRTASQVWLGIPPLVGSVLAQEQATVGRPVRLHADIAGPGPLTVVWDLGDGRRLPIAEPEVAFPAAGNYNISVEVSNPGGSVTRQINLIVLPVPLASFRPDDDTPAVGQPVTFINRSGGQPPLNVFWDFGDGTTLVGQQEPTHTYSRGGAYRVRLTIENGIGRSEAIQDIVVGVAPIADMVIPDRTAVGQPLVGQAFSEDGATRITWDMGDGRSYEGPNVSHQYRRPGDYYVTMTADNGHGLTQVGKWVHVDSGISTLFLPLATLLIGGESVGLNVEDPAELILDPAVERLDGVFTLDPIPFPNGTSLAEQLFAYLNAARARFELPPLTYNYELSSAAQDHARDKARFPDNPHVGTDGTTAAERLLRSSYRGGYAGEATAWGFSDPRLAVEFWINSDSHRPILLNRITNDVGVGYLEDYASANVWHWTAEFGVSYGAPIRATLRAQYPLAGHTALDTDVVNYSWVWPLRPASGERFTVYLVSGERYVSLGSIAQPVYGSLYTLSIDARRVIGAQATTTTRAIGYDWVVRLESGTGQVLAESERRLISFMPDPAATLPLATAVPTLPIVTATPNTAPPVVSPSPVPTEVPPTSELPPVIITATPRPTMAP
ncbi:MAG: PKD domain-containing protein [Candidatus Promineofilum sp.]|nr:PKD domain-containing protein [Promineifilum sp.]MBP9657373.1 PKD domain-containing protein [Promineifilum sp.]